jgi:hypothetical protein
MIGINNLYSQENFIFKDTINYDNLKAYNITYEKCPGYISGLPCYKFLNILSGKNNFKVCYKNLKENKETAIYNLSKNDTIIIDKKYFKRASFANQNIEIKDKSSFEITFVKEKKKFHFSTIEYKNLKVVILSVEKNYLNNNVLYNNIIIKSKEKYINVMLIINGS